MRKKLRELPPNKRILIYDRAKELLDGGFNREEVAETLDVSEFTIRHWQIGDRHPERAFKIPNLKPSRELSYILGVYYGDGYVSKYGKWHRIGLWTIDREFAEEFSHCLSKVVRKESNPIRLSPRNNQYRTHLSNVMLYNFLKRPLNSHRKLIGEFPVDFLRGFFDSEGTVGISHDGRGHSSIRIKAYNTNLSLLKFVVDLLETRFSIRTQRIRITRMIGEKVIIKGFETAATKNCYSLEIGEQKSVLMFYHKVGFSIKRKRKLFGEN